MEAFFFLQNKARCSPDLDGPLNGIEFEDGLSCFILNEILAAIRLGKVFCNFHFMGAFTVQPLFSFAYSHLELMVHFVT